LTYEEEVLWSLIKSRQEEFWRNSSCVDSDELTTAVFNFDLLRKRWNELKAEASEKAVSEPAVQIGGFPFRGGRIDTSIPETLAKDGEDK
jgi:hypothetical protein